VLLKRLGGCLSVERRRSLRLVATSQGEEVGFSLNAFHRRHPNFLNRKIVENLDLVNEIEPYGSTHPVWHWFSGHLVTCGFLKIHKSEILYLHRGVAK